MQTTAWMPWICAASATPCAWLPADEQTTPRRFWSSVRYVNLFSGPRILYEPVFWKISAFEPDVEARALAEDARRQQRRLVDVRRDDRPRALEVRPRQHGHRLKRESSSPPPVNEPCAGAPLSMNTIECCDGMSNFFPHVLHVTESSTRIM